MRPVDAPVSVEYGLHPHATLGREVEHAGMDFEAAAGTPIVASQDGEVLFEGWYGGYGKSVILYHGKEVVTLYAHNVRNAVKKGQKVKKGDVIGYVGATGLTTGPHLHFEVRKAGQPVDPAQYLAKDAQ